MQDIFVLSQINLEHAVKHEHTHTHREEFKGEFVKLPVGVLAPCQELKPFTRLL